MFVQPIDYFVTGWLLLALACALYIAFDQYRNNPEPVVMKWGSFSNIRSHPISSRNPRQRRSSPSGH